MTIIVDSSNAKVVQGETWTQTILADQEIIGQPALAVSLWLFEAGGEGPEQIHNGEDQLLYVIRGSGTAIVNGETFSLNEESVLWLELGEQYQFKAGEAGLEILQGYNNVNQNK